MQLGEHWKLIGYGDISSTQVTDALTRLNHLPFTTNWELEIHVMGSSWSQLLKDLHTGHSFAVGWVIQIWAAWILEGINRDNCVIGECLSRVGQ